MKSLFVIFVLFLMCSCGSSIKGYVDQADALVAEGRSNEAILVYHRALKEHPKDPTLYLNQAALFRHSQKYTRAVKNYNIVQTLNPDLPHPYIGRAKVFLAQSAFNEARNEIENLLRLIPDNSEALYFLGRISYHLGQGYQAETYLNEALKKGYSEDRVLLLRGRVYHELLKNSDRARADYQRYLEIGGSRVEDVKKRLTALGG